MSRSTKSKPPAPAPAVFASFGNVSFFKVSAQDGGFHIHGGTFPYSWGLPRNGWVLPENPNLKWMMTGVPL